MTRVSNSLTAFTMVLLFALGVLCSTMVAPGQSLASVTGCSQTGGAMEMAGCQYPSYLCGFGSSSNLFSQGALGSARSDNRLKNVLSLVVGDAPLAASNDGALSIGKERRNSSLVEPRKVSIRLFNSILNL